MKRIFIKLKKIIYGDVRNAALKKRIFKGCLPAAAVVESAGVIPLFVFAVMSLISIITVIGTMARVRKSVFESIREAESIPYVLERELSGDLHIKAAATLAQIKKSFTKELPSDSRIVSSASGVDFEKSKIFDVDAGMFVKADYKIKLFPILFRETGLNASVEMQTYAWLGEDYMKSTASEDDRMVFMTSKGAVYHEDRNCTYLAPKVHEESLNTINEKRNANGEKYRECLTCGKKETVHDLVYVTEYGNRYHADRNCQKIKHEIISVPLSELKGVHKCSKEEGLGK